MSAEEWGTRAGPLRMVNTVRGYDWGSREALARIQNRPASETPEAELWMGTHPGAPSYVARAGAVAERLDELIAADPEGTVGKDVAERFGPRLPFLLKILAIDKALSVQVHPDARQARVGHATGSPHYTDPYPKPELLYAITDVDALAGLRPAPEALALFERLGLADLDDVVAALRAGSSGAALAALAGIPAERREALTAAADSAAAAVLAPPQDHVQDHVDLSDDDRVVFEWVRRLVVQHPGDPLVVAPLLMRLLRLAPGGSFFVPAGVPHAYLAGTGVEIMSESDNVVRAGLTSKAVDVGELMALLAEDAAPLLDVPTAALPSGETALRPPVEHFELLRLEVDGEAVPVADLPGPQVVLCLSGDVVVTAGAGSVELSGGDSAFVPVGARPVVISGDGVVFRALPASEVPVTSGA